MQFFRELADRQATVCRQQALEATLLRQATAEVWFARGTRTRTSASGKGDESTDDIDVALSPLGPRLAWLACEELTSFFQQHSVNAAGNTRLRGGQGPTNPGTGVSPLGLLQNFLPHSRLTTTVSAGLFGDSRESRGSVFGGSTGGTESDGLLPPRKDQLVKQAVATMGLNLILPGSAHHGAAFDPDSPCGFCDLALSGDSDGDVVAGADIYRAVESSAGDAGLAVKACGHGFHVRCLMEGGPCRAGGVGENNRGSWLDEVGSSFSPCPRCS